MLIVLQNSRDYELINYSCYGTYVNNVLYSNDLTERNYAATAEKKPIPVELQVREIIDKKRKVQRSRRTSFDAGCKMTAMDCLNRMECFCTTNNAEELRAGWEGPAILKHGTLLRFGCVSFVFSVVDCGNA